MKVFWKSKRKGASAISELSQKLAEHIASEVVLLALDLHKPGTPEKV